MKPLTHIWLRHARPLVPKGYIYGALEDVPVNLTGFKTRSAFLAIGQLLPSRFHVECSTSPRAQLSLQEVLDLKAEPPPIHPNESFLEQSFGDWTGKNIADLKSDPGMLAYAADRENVAPPGGESLSTFMRRVSPGIDDVNARYLSGEIEHDTVLSSAHGGTIRAAMAKADQVPLSTMMSVPIRRLSITRIQWDPEATGNPWKILSVNETLTPET